MFRTARRIGPLVGSLLTSAFVVSGTLATAGLVAGCGDENDPETHVKKLSDPGTRPAAVKRLIQFFEDAMTRDQKDRNGPTVKPLLDKIIEPMTQMCVSGDLDERTNSNLVKFLSDARDPRAEACLVKVLKEYKVDATEEDVRWVSRAAGAMKLKAAGEPLLQVFIKMHASKPKADAIYRDVHDALMDLSDPSWEGQLIGLVSRPINDRKDGAMLKDEMFWQITAAELLGNMKATGAVKPLLKATLSPLKVETSNTALNALIKIGKPSIDPTLALLKGDDKDLVEYSKLENMKAAGGGGDAKAADAKGASTAYLGTAASILAAIGRQEASGPFIEVLAKAPDDLSRAIMARELVNLPSTPEIKKAFQEAYEKTPVNLQSPLLGSGREALLDRAGWFFDASFVPWLIKTAKDAKGDADDVDPIRASSLLTAIKLMTPEQIAVVESLNSMKATGSDGKPMELGKAYEKEWKVSKEVLAACTDKVECYLAKLAEPASQQKETAFLGIKSIYMVGVLGTPEVKGRLVDLMPKLTNGDVRGFAGVVIDHFSPKGDTVIAARLQKIVDDAEASKDAGKKAATSSLKQVIYRLNARAQ